MTCHAVVGFDEESADVGAAVGLADLVLVEAREATPFGDVFFPRIDLDLAVELALGLLNGEKLCFGREPFFGQAAREKSRQRIDQKERDNADDRGEQDLSEGAERMEFCKNEVEEGDEKCSRRNGDEIKHDDLL